MCKHLLLIICNFRSVCAQFVLIFIVCIANSCFEYVKHAVLMDDFEQFVVGRCFHVIFIACIIRFPNIVHYAFISCTSQSHLYLFYACSPWMMMHTPMNRKRMVDLKRYIISGCENIPCGLCRSVENFQYANVCEKF